MTTLFGKAQNRIIVAGGRDFNDYILLSETLDAVLKRYTDYNYYLNLNLFHQEKNHLD